MSRPTDRAAYDPPQELIDLVDRLREESIVRHSTGGEDPETFTECRLCGGWEDHADDCPIPAIERWLDAPATPEQIAARARTSEPESHEPGCDTYFGNPCSCSPWKETDDADRDQ